MARLPKRKFAILMSYAGTGYHGMQINQLTPTIELAVLKSFRKAGLISTENWPVSLTMDEDENDLIVESNAIPTDDTKIENQKIENGDDEKKHHTEAIMDTCTKIGFQRSCRTDKGVHAARQLIAATLCVPPSSDTTVNEDESNEDLTISDETLEEVNKHLPPTIRIWQFQRVTRRFHAKNMCSGRIYEYLLPTSILQPDDETNAAKCFAGGTPMTMEMILERRQAEAKMYEAQRNGEEIERPITERLPPRSKEDIEKDAVFRISEDQLKRVRGVLKQFVGTHNFHNYTVGRPHWEASSQRHITSFEVCFVLF